MLGNRVLLHQLQPAGGIFLNTQTSVCATDISDEVPGNA